MKTINITTVRFELTKNRLEVDQEFSGNYIEVNGYYFLLPEKRYDQAFMIHQLNNCNIYLELYLDEFVIRGNLRFRTDQREAHGDFMPRLKRYVDSLHESVGAMKQVLKTNAL